MADRNTRWTREGGSREIPARAAERAATRYTVDGECWITTYSVGSHGYGQVGWGEPDGTKRVVGTHRAAWSHHFGPIPDGFTVDHIRGICTSRKCVNPEHLRLLTNVDNAMDNGSADRRRLTPVGEMCPKCGGHDVVQVGRTQTPTCRPCRRAYRRAWRASRRAAGLPTS